MEGLGIPASDRPSSSNGALEFSLVLSSEAAPHAVGFNVQFLGRDTFTNLERRDAVVSLYREDKAGISASFSQVVDVGNKNDKFRPKVSVGTDVFARLNNLSIRRN